MNYIKIAKWFYQQGRDDQVYDKSRTFEEGFESLHRNPKRQRGVQKNLPKAY